MSCQREFVMRDMPANATPCPTLNYQVERNMVRLGPCSRVPHNSLLSPPVMCDSRVYKKGVSCSCDAGHCSSLSSGHVSPLVETRYNSMLGMSRLVKQDTVML